MKNKVTLLALFFGLGVYAVMPVVNVTDVFGTSAALASDRGHDGGGGDHDGNDHNAGGGGGGDDDGHDDDHGSGHDDSMDSDSHGIGQVSSGKCKSLACLFE